MSEPHHSVLDPRITRGLIARLRLTRLLGRFPERPVWTAFMFINGFITIAMLAATYQAAVVVLHNVVPFPPGGRQKGR